MKKIVYIVISLVGTFLLGDVIYLNIMESQNQRVAVVQMEDFVYNFKGMKDASMDYSKKLDNWNGQIDSLKGTLEGLYHEIQMDSINNNKAKLAADIDKFKYIQKIYVENQQKLNDKATEDDKNMTQGILNQLNEYVKEYAEKNGYDIVLANNQQNNVLFNAEFTDITQDLLNFANMKYDDK